ncbi:DUF2935 domain-containing protein [Candidatus Clostridium stratigraminis]|uniref:DUF2935 domain-containing protein n=1 Tax=Candidatus Clostridium stratigraminis TaxID=3381661 RepID=A0ABW8T497_9CLOT
MIKRLKFISQSLELNLFFLRIMKEHSIFLEAAFTPRDKNLAMLADSFKNEFTRLLSHTAALSNGVISEKALQSNEFVTKYTAAAEKATQYFTGIFIDPGVTSMEGSIRPGIDNKGISMLEEQVYMLNNSSLGATNKIINFKKKLRADVLNCRIFTTNYPHLINHIIKEAVTFTELLKRLQSGNEINSKKDILKDEIFWDDIMSEHSFFIRGMLDPTEEELFNMANNFGKEFEALSKEASEAYKSTLETAALTNNTLKETSKLRDFKAQATEGLLGCKIKSIILPLLSDHVLREANHYLNLLED